MRRGQRGYTLVEVLVVVAILGLLTATAIPKFQDALYRGKAAKIVEDFSVVRNAVFQYYIDHGAYPPDTLEGTMPPELVPYLGHRVNFTQNGYLYDWELWITPSGDPKHPETGVLTGFSVLTDDEKLKDACRRLYRGDVLTTIDDRITFVVEAYKEP